MSENNKKAFEGKLFLIKIKNTSNSYENLGGIRANDIEINHRQIDITNKGSRGWRELMPNNGITSMSISGRGIFTNSSTENTIIDMAMKGTIQDIKIISESKNTWEGKFACSNYKRLGTYEGEENYYIVLESAGEITFEKNGNS